MKKLIDAYALRCEMDKHWPFSKIGQTRNPAANAAKSVMLEIIDQLPTIEIPTWIPTAERMPEKDGKYLCCWQGMSIDTGLFLNGHFRLYGEIRDNLVTAWMPLPAMYEVPDAD